MTEELSEAVQRLLEWAEPRMTWQERLTWFYPVKYALADALAERERQEYRQEQQEERREQQAEKMRQGRERKRQQPGRCEGRKPYGTEPHEAEILAWILAEHNKGTAYNAIARELNEKKFWRTRSGKPWDAGTVRKLCLRAAK